MIVFDEFSCWWRNKEKKKKLETINFIIVWEIFMFYQMMLLPQVKRCATISNKHGIYELTHELPNDLGLKILGN